MTTDDRIKKLSASIDAALDAWLAMSDAERLEVSRRFATAFHRAGMTAAEAVEGFSAFGGTLKKSADRGIVDFRGITDAPPNVPSVHYPEEREP